jgi:predicted dehydrogenase/threonine dehydrogenase-like Zn-dependent dehydrogenase
MPLQPSHQEHIQLKQVLVKSGGVVVEDVPASEVGRRNILVRVSHSCISVGTEMAGVRGSGQSLYRRALKQPDKAWQALRMVREHGLLRTASFITGKLGAASPTGYSAAGRVIAIGPDVKGFVVGEYVACAGGGIANHAEVIDVPVNLAVRIPAGLGTAASATVTLGAIALQGVRRTAPTLGETVVVIGLGILGQISAQLLRANGCRVIGVDLDPERIRVARENGLDHGVDPALENYVERVGKMTDGIGADAVIVTAASADNRVISEAMQACRKKGRVVLVGDVGLDLNRGDFYKKELDFLISTSYGPGRYDAEYEEGGRDYPLPYVRWTENRNMEEYLRLLADGKLSLANMMREPYEIDDAAIAYEALKAEGPNPLMVLLAYPPREEAVVRSVNLVPRTYASGAIRVALVGAGGFAQSMHLPNMERLKKSFQLRAVMSRTGATAKAVAKQFGASYATTDFSQVLKDPDVDLVLIATRHDLHARMVLEALKAGKSVFVEKPLAIAREELSLISDFFAQTQNPPVLMTGFNRRFSPAMQRAKEVLRGRMTPLIVNYRMNAGYIPLDVWVHGAEGGGRNIGEACHIYDLFNFFTDAAVESVHATAIAPTGKQWARNDNFVATVAYTDGSVCTLTYTALGDNSHPKERMDIYGDGKVISMDNFTQLTIAGGKFKGWSAATADKGQLPELKALASCMLHGGHWPISLDQQLQATTISFEVERQIRYQE